MEVKTKKTFSQKVSYDPKLDDVQKKVKSFIKEQKFDEMLIRVGENKLKSLVKG